MPSWYQFQPTVSDLFQNGFVQREAQEGLDTNMAYRRHASQRMFAGHIGSQLIIPKVGRKAPVTTPLNSATIGSNLDNGMTPSQPPAENYTIDLSEWGDTQDIDIFGAKAAAVDLVLFFARTSAVQAAQSLERLARIGVHACYDTGNTFVRGDIGSNLITKVWVNDLRGFQQVQVSGGLVPVSVGDPLPCYELAAVSGGVNQIFSVTGWVADSPNQSVYPGSSLDSFGNVISDGVSGYLTITGATSVPVTGDAIVAGNAPKIVRPYNKPSENILKSGDVATLRLVLDAMTRLSLNNVPRFRDGTYHLLCDAAFISQLFNDPAFLTAYASRYKSQEWQDGQIFELLGVTFIETTETYLQPAQPTLGMNYPIRRSIMLGADAFFQATFDGMETYGMDDDMGDPSDFIRTVLINNVAHIFRGPLDRLKRFMSITWTFVGSWVCPTDGTATPIIIPTANNALYKRACVIHTVG